ncbi:hypothetical protein N0V83_001135 [Neocucurbitaria cava]|uniref:Uncharacterized protein n=1 Tax=Neocucurbitaria cava TaxID=798079 RepID=A0A9W8YF06_9PLEO|nr:hypothetical protein N0V83_001135 [Neocucurbitaria cava]
MTYESDMTARIDELEEKNADLKEEMKDLRIELRDARKPTVWDEEEDEEVEPGALLRQEKTRADIAEAQIAALEAEVTALRTDKEDLLKTVKRYQRREEERGVNNSRITKADNKQNKS